MFRLRLPRFITALLLVRSMPMCIAQVPVISGSYVQDFGTTDITSWTNNVTIPGWYTNMGVLGGHLNITTSAPTNTGGFYSYECNGLNDQKLGSRASGSAPIVRYGVVLWNQTSLPIHSIRVSYLGYQFSLAQNGNVVNTLTLDHVVSTSIPSINAAATGIAPLLDFQQLQNSAVAGSNQILGYPCTQVRSITGCIDLSPALAPGSYILLRWTDVNDTNNDHHLAVDNVQVDFDLTSTGCNVLLPVELLSFEASRSGPAVSLEWSTATESNNSHFVVARSVNGVFFEPLFQVRGAGDSFERIDYRAIDPAPFNGMNYYRLQQYDHDGSGYSSTVRPVLFQGAGDTRIRIHPVPVVDGRCSVHVPEELDGARYEIVDGRGMLVARGHVTAPMITLTTASWSAGIHVLTLVKDTRSHRAMFIVQ